MHACTHDLYVVGLLDGGSVSVMMCPFVFPVLEFPARCVGTPVGTSVLQVDAVAYYRSEAARFAEKERHAMARATEVGLSLARGVHAFIACMAWCMAVMHDSQPGGVMGAFLDFRDLSVMRNAKRHERSVERRRQHGLGLDLSDFRKESIEKIQNAFSLPGKLGKGKRH
jgi:hypothetical protein